MTTEATMRAGAELTKFLVEAYRTERGVHAETVIGGAAALAGEFALRAVEPVLPETGWVTSRKASTLLFGTDPMGTTGLCTLIRQGAMKAGAEESEIPELEEVAARAAEAVGGSPYPPLSVPEGHYPHEWSPNACPRLRLGAEHICRGQGLSGREKATALAVAVAFLINETREVLPPAIGARLALEVMIGVSHMVPLAQETATPGGGPG